MANIGALLYFVLRHLGTLLRLQFITNFSLFTSTFEELPFKVPTGSAMLNLFPVQFEGTTASPEELHASAELTAAAESAAIKDNNLPLAFDWRNQQKITSVRDQSKCNACYAFAVTSAVESALAIYYGINITTANGTATAHTNQSSVYLVSEHIPNSNVHYVNLNLSVQQLIDCTFMTNRSKEQPSQQPHSSGHYRNNACQFGYIEDTFRYVAEEGLVPEEVYPYRRNVSECRQLPEYINRTFISTFHKEVNLSSGEIKKLIYQTGPVISLINDQGRDFLYYKSGIIHKAASPGEDHFSTPNHAVLIIGWGVLNGTEFYVIKNSWSEQWGEGGFARIELGARAIGKYIFYPIQPEPGGRLDRFKANIVYIFLAILIAALLAFYCFTQFCSSRFYQKKVRGSKYLRIRYFKAKPKPNNAT